MAKRLRELRFQEWQNTLQSRIEHMQQYIDHEIPMQRTPVQIQHGLDEHCADYLNYRADRSWKEHTRTCFTIEPRP